MDLLTLRPVREPMRFVPAHPVTGEDLAHEGKPVVILVKGVDHPDMESFERRVNQRRIDRGAAAGRVKLSSDELEAENTARVVAAIAGWENLSMGGPVEYSLEKAKDVVIALPWLKDQVEAFYRDRANFIEAGSKKSTEKNSKST
jgi:hypothetical protein